MDHMAMQIGLRMKWVRTVKKITINRRSTYADFNENAALVEMSIYGVVVS